MQGANLQALQRKRKHALALVIALCIGLLLISDSHWRTASPFVHVIIEQSGMILIVLCILGRTWCALYIGGYKRRELITKGPYSVVRNPLYVFTSLGAAGIGVLFGSLIAGALFAAASLAIFFVVVRREEDFLAAAFSREFQDYSARVPRFLPRFSLWSDAAELCIRPHLVRRTFLDASLFLIAIPALDLIRLAQYGGWLPVWWQLP